MAGYVRSKLCTELASVCTNYASSSDRANGPAEEIVRLRSDCDRMYRLLLRWVRDEWLGPNGVDDEIWQDTLNELCIEEDDIDTSLEEHGL